MSRYNYGGFPKYVRVADKKAKAEKKIKQLKKKDPNISPVYVTGNKLAESWWGISWNKNLESYADFGNRIGRGRSYIRHSAVLDLKIKPGKIISLVQGSMSRPYNIEITIKKIKPSLWKNIIKKCQGKIDSLNTLLDGNLPKAMAGILTNKEEGMFPSPDEIEFNCSCPDWAYMCKHIAATLYGVGTRLDQDPAMFFTLRGAKIKDLVSQAIKAEANQLIEKSKTKTSKRIIENADLSSAFGIDFDDSAFLPDGTKPDNIKPVSSPPSQQKQTITSYKRVQLKLLG
ncbi:MAG: SWIM zinc finger family protein, partial [Desulfobacterales bacterium]|nr:SWIM zinc finger family protein [Desulfobacterales bacterium]